jgi:drug/metabolite transporter (DMT)-like permease
VHPSSAPGCRPGAGGLEAAGLGYRTWAGSVRGRATGAGEFVTDNLKGILAICGSATAFVFNDALTKLATEELPTGQLIVLRGLMATVLLGAVAWWFGACRDLSVLKDRVVVARVLAAGAATIFIVLSLKYLPLAIVTAVLQMSPLAVTAASAVLLAEAVGWRRWAAALTGFLGVLLIVQPTGGGDMATHAWIVLVALALTTLRDLTTRMLAKAVPGMLVAAASSAVITVAGLAFYPFETWVTPSHRALALLAGAAFFLLFAYNLVIYAMRTGEISVVAPFRYSIMLLALALGYAVWGDVPNTLAVAGIALVVGAGLYTLHRERLTMREARLARARAGGG